MQKQKQKITIEDLAQMVQKGFMETAKKIDMDLQFKVVNQRLKAVEERLSRVEKRLSHVEERLDRVENILMIDRRRKMERLTTEMKDLKELSRLSNF